MPTYKVTLKNRQGERTTHRVTAPDEATAKKLAIAERVAQHGGSSHGAAYSGTRTVREEK